MEKIAVVINAGAATCRAPENRSELINSEKTRIN